MSEGLLEFLNRYASVSAADFTELMQRVEIKEYDKKVRLTEIGRVEEHMYFVVKGLTRKFFYKGKDEIITHLVKEGGIIGSAASFFSGLPSKYIVETIEPSTLISITREKLEALYRSDNRWEKVGRMMTTHFFLQQEFRNLDNIRLSTRERFVSFMKENPDLLQRVPQKYLASYLNIKPETFSRMKHLMLEKKQGPEKISQA